MNKLFLVLVVACMCSTLLNCRKQPEQNLPTFTSADSVTHIYLEYKDSLMDIWNMLMHADNSRIATVRNLIHELQSAGASDPRFLEPLIHRTDQLLRIRFTPKTISNYDVVEEYDFAAASVITEAITAAQSLPDYSSRTYLQKLISEIYYHDSLVVAYRHKYDGVAKHYNAFLDNYKNILKEIDQAAASDRRPLFELAEE